VRHGFVPSPRIIHDINVGLTRVDLRVRVPRYHCRDCGATFNHVFDSIPEGKHLTYRLYEQIKRDAFLRPFAEVASEYGYSEGTIRNIFDEFAAELEENRGPIIAPEVLGIDEKHIVNEMRGVFVDIKTGKLLEMTERNKREDVIGTIEKMVDYDKNIRIVTTDMANNYKSYIHECLPSAKIIVDKYHVFQDLSRKVAKCKTAIMGYIDAKIKAETGPDVAQFLSGVRGLLLQNAYLFKFSRETLQEKPRRLTIMAEVCHAFPEFNHLRLIKEGFERIYDCEDRSAAEKRYKEWVVLVPPTGKNQIKKWEATYGVPSSLYDELRTFYRTTKKWHDEIFNYFDEDSRYTNAAAEGTNSLIQRINSEGAGYGFARLRAKVLFRNHTGGRRTYVIKKTTVSSGFDWLHDSGNFMRNVIPRTSQTREEIIETTKSIPIQALSVLHYINEDNPFYDFDEE
jgi:transposase